MRTVLRGKVTLLFIVCAALLAFGGTAMALVTDPSGDTSATTSPVPTITSDLADYPPGATVNLSGSNWQAGENVHIYVNDDSGKTWDYNADVTADDSGNISHTFNLPDWFVATYKVTATGETSGVATHTFTDAIATTTTLTSAPNPSNVNSNVTFTATVACSQNCTFDTSPSSTQKVQFWQQSNINNNCNNGNAQNLLGTVSASSFTGSGNSRTATFVHAFSTSGSKPVTACFIGGGPNLTPGTSVSSVLTQNVNAVTSTSVSDITATTSAFGGTTDLSAKVSPAGAPGSVAFFVNGSSTAASGTVNYNSSTGVATLSNYSHGLNASATPYSVRAVFTPSGSGFSGSEATNASALTVNKANQTITFAQPTTPQTFGDTFHVNPTSDSGLNVSLTDSNNGVCTVQSVASGGYDVTMTSGTGNCVLTASQAGNSNYSAATNVERTVAAQKKAQTITFGNLSDKVVNAADFTVSANASSGLSVTFSSLTPSKCSVSTTGTVHLLTDAAGTCTIRASQAGNANYNAAPNVDRSFNIGYNFIGFAAPVDNTNSYMNVLKAGQAIPLKWRLLDANNQPVVNLPSVAVTATTLSCSLGATDDLMEEVAAGASGLQNLGNGYYQFNWASPKSYASSCKTLNLNLGEGNTNGVPVTRTAQFKFTK